MTKYKIMLKGHEGVASCDEECWGESYGDTEKEAIEHFVANERIDNYVTYYGKFKCYYAGARKIFAVPIEE